MSDLDRVAEEIRRWGYAEPGFADRYERHRPRPPEVLLEMLPWLAGGGRPRLVVDVGSGTGLSTRFWAEHAGAVVGVEPLAEMREVAAAATDAPNVSYVAAPAHATGLDEGSADIVTCSQSLQWMAPEPTLAEIARILRRGGVFAAYEYRWLLLASPEAKAAFEDVFERKNRLRAERGLDQGRSRWPVSRERLEESGRFRFTAETTVHGLEHGNADRLVGFVLSEGSTATLLEAGVTEKELGLARLREVAATGLGSEPTPWYLGYRVILGSR
jgi:SAM-dependent methyltransferase